MTTYTRREFVSTASSALLLTALPACSIAAKDSPLLSLNDQNVKIPSHELKSLPFDPTAVTGLSEKLLKSHWQNNYGGSVKALNAVNHKLDSANKDESLPPYIFNDLKREHLLRTNSVVLHELYFANLGAADKPSESIKQALGSHFGGMTAWDKQFRRMGKGLGGGSGWVVLGYNLHNGLVENYWLWDHLHSPAMTLPLLVMDMYEHSYQIDYGADAAAYIDAFMKNIRWETVAKRLETAIKIRAL
jgi:Fe-Mn family superoxide dismutase